MSERTRPESDAVNEESTEVNRRKFLKCMAWAGTGIVWTVSAGGLLTACGDLTATTTPPTTAATTTIATATTTPPTTAATTTIATTTTAAATATTKPADESFSFVQISDTHIGFSTDGVNTDVLGTAKQAVDRINALPNRPALVIHTGDISHNSKPAEFDTASQLMTTLKTDKVFYVPGEHDLVNDKGANYRQRFSTNTKPWYSMDYKGVHFIGLSNAGELDAFGMLGDEQISWLKQDLSGVKKDTSLVVFAHVPLYSIYPQWGWETKDVAQVMTMLMPYSAVTVLNGHIHQVLSKVEGNISFYTANATAFPQHRPGVDKPNAYKLPASELLQSIGYRTVTLVPGKPGPQITDTTLAGTPAAAAAVGPITLTTSPALVSDGTNPLDVGPLTDFAATDKTPRQLSVSLPTQKKSLTMFVVQNGPDYVALSDVCTHQGCEVSWNQTATQFQCPCHGSQYDMQGKNVAGPAPRPLTTYKTQVVNGRLMITVQA